MPRVLWYIILGALAVRLILLIAVASGGTEKLMTSDSYGFLQSAQNILAGHGFSRSDTAPFIPDAHFPPVYPLLMAGSLALSHSLLPLVIVQIILSSLMPILIWRIGEFLTEEKRILLAASVLMAFEPITVFWSLTPLTEVVSVFFLLVGVYFFLRLIRTRRSRDAAAAGLWLALSTLTRPHAQFLFILGLIFLIVSSVRKSKSEGFQSQIASILLFTGIFIAVLAPWLARNYYQFGTVSVASTGLRNVYSSIGSSVLSLHTGEAVGDVRERLNQEFAKKYRVSERDIKENPALGSALAKEGLLILRDHPKETAEVIAIDLVAFLTQDLWADYLQRFQLIPSLPIDFSPSLVLIKQGPDALANLLWQKLGWRSLIPLAGRAVWTLMAFFSFIGLIVACRVGKKERSMALIMACIVLYYAATSSIAGFSDQGRFRYPAHAFLFLLASYGFIKPRKKPELSAIVKTREESESFDAPFGNRPKNR